MKIPEHLNKPLLEQLSDQADSDDYLIMRGSALGYGLLNDIENRNEITQIIVDDNQDLPEFLKNLYNDKEQYTYLEKEFSSENMGFNHKVKLFKINFEVFDSIMEN